MGNASCPKPLREDKAATLQQNTSQNCCHPQDGDCETIVVTRAAWGWGSTQCRLYDLLAMTVCERFYGRLWHPPRQGLNICKETVMYASKAVSQRLG
eukprot:1440479-Amphidinium_carterae.1